MLKFNSPSEYLFVSWVWMGSEIPICACPTSSAISLCQVQRGINLQIDAVIAFPDIAVSQR